MSTQTPFDIVVNKQSEVLLYLVDGTGAVAFQRETEDWERDSKTVSIEIPRSDIPSVIARLQQLLKEPAHG